MYQTTMVYMGQLSTGTRGGTIGGSLICCWFLGKKNIAGADFGELSRAVACPTNLVLFILMNLVGIC
jgi:hypothetical protein